MHIFVEVLVLIFESRLNGISFGDKSGITSEFLICGRVVSRLLVNFISALLDDLNLVDLVLVVILVLDVVSVDLLLHIHCSSALSIGGVK
jgi:hypothetical protein